MTASTPRSRLRRSGPSRDADLVLLVVDATVGVTPEDEDVARLVRRSGRPVMVVANKVDNEQREFDAWELRLSRTG